MNAATLRAYGEPPSSVAYLMAHPDLMATLVITFDGHPVTVSAPQPINPPSAEDGS